MRRPTRSLFLQGVQNHKALHHIGKVPLADSISHCAILGWGLGIQWHSLPDSTPQFSDEAWTVRDVEQVPAHPIVGAGITVSNSSAKRFARSVNTLRGKCSLSLGGFVNS